MLVSIEAGGGGTPSVVPEATPAFKILDSMLCSADVKLRKRLWAPGGITAIRLLTRANPSVPVGVGCPTSSVNALKALVSLASSRMTEVKAGSAVSDAIKDEPALSIADAFSHGY